MLDGAFVASAGAAPSEAAPAEAAPSGLSELGELTELEKLPELEEMLSWFLPECTSPAAAGAAEETLPGNLSWQAL